MGCQGYLSQKVHVMFMCSCHCVTMLHTCRLCELIVQRKCASPNGWKVFELEEKHNEETQMIQALSNIPSLSPFQRTQFAGTCILRKS